MVESPIYPLDIFVKSIDSAADLATVHSSIFIKTIDSTADTYVHLSFEDTQ